MSKLQITSEPVKFDCPEVRHPVQLDFIRSRGSSDEMPVYDSTDCTCTGAMECGVQPPIEAGSPCKPDWTKCVFPNILSRIGKRM